MRNKICYKTYLNDYHKYLPEHREQSYEDKGTQNLMGMFTEHNYLMNM